MVNSGDFLLDGNPTLCNYVLMADLYDPPTPRVRTAVLEVQNRDVQEAGNLGLLQHESDEYLMVVNEARQIVYASPSLLKVFGNGTFLGNRPGEYLGCIHADGQRCGLTEFCKFCGAAKAIVSAQKKQREVNSECTVRTESDGLTITYNFNVRTIPLEMKDNKYIVVLLEDVSAEKHRRALERIFFHDVLNTATGLKAYLDVLKRQVSADADRDLVKRVVEIADTLVDEIQSQKILSSAENGTLTPSRQIVISHELVRAVIAQYEHQDLAENKTLTFAPGGDSFSLVTDETILRRTIGNMVKNALEAAGPGDTVTIRCRKNSEAAVFEVHNPGVMPEEAQANIFSRFFTTKGEGRGLGTYSMKLLAERYLRGEVAFTSTEKDGTVFALSLPLKEVP